MSFEEYEKILSKKEQIPPPNASYSVFISYSSKDSPLVKSIVDYISQINGLKIFFADRSLQPGDIISTKIIDNIKTANAFLLFYSQSAHESSYVQHEIGVSLVNNKLIIPLLIDDTKPSGMLGNVHYLKLSDPQIFQSEARRLYDFLYQSVQQKIQDDRNKALGILALVGFSAWLLGSSQNSDIYDDY